MKAWLTVKFAIMALALAACSENSNTPQTVVIVGGSQQEDGPVIGQHMPIDAIITLAEQERVSFFDASGRLHRIAGPYYGAIGGAAPITAPTSSGQELLLSVSEYLKGADRTRRLAGATRGSLEIEPWLVPVLAFYEQGAICIPIDKPILWWRPITHAEAGLELTLTSEKGDVIGLTFPSGQALGEASTQSLSQGSYQLAVDGRDSKIVRISSVSAEEFTLVPLYLHERGCTKQFQMLITDLAGLEWVQP